MTRRTTRQTGRSWVWLTAGCVAAVVAWQAWLVGAHWIDPDEGAHLMDARLAAEGLVPEVDFDARQPLYVYTYLPAFHFLDDDYRSGRVMPLLFTLLTGVVLWFIGRRSWGRAEAHAAFLLFMLAPSIVINSTVAKTEPLAMLLFALGILGLVVHLRSGRWWPLLLSGAAFGVGYYVRESTLAGVMAAGLVCLGHLREGARRLLSRAGVFLAGFAIIVAAVLVGYSPHAPVPELLGNDTLFPPARITGALGNIAGWVAPGEAVEESGTARQSDQNWSSTFEHLRTAVHLNLHLLAGVLVAAALWWWRRRSRQHSISRTADRLGLVVGFSWLGSLALLYAYHVLSRGFFQSYIRELIPPMALLSGWAVIQLLRDSGWEKRAAALTPVILLGFVGVGAARLSHPGTAMAAALAAIAGVGWVVFHPPVRRYVLTWMALAACYAVVVWSPAYGGPRPSLQLIFPWLAMAMVVALAMRNHKSRASGTARRFIALSLLAAAGVLTAAYSGKTLSPAFDCDWSPATVAGAVDAIRAVSEPSDEVLSGGMVWTLESDRQPFMRITHPLSHTDGMSGALAGRIARQLETAPPRIVVLDHYTQWAYGDVPALLPLVQRSYRKIWEHEDPVRPVEVYVFDPPTRRKKRR